MYRAPADTKLLNIILRLLPRHPEHIDAFVAYFSNFTKRTKIARVALDYLSSGLPYSYVRGELWHIVARLGGIPELQRGLPLAREDAKNRKLCVALSWGVMHFLLRCESEGLAKIGRRLKAEHPISRALLTPVYLDREFAKGGIVVTLLKGSLMEQLAGVRALQKRKISLNSIGLRQRNLPQTCKNSLASLGVIKRHHRKSTRDWIADRLVKIYRCQNRNIWRELLGSEYEHASQILIEAEVNFNGAYSNWLSLQDSFNDIATRKFFSHLISKGQPGHSRTRTPNGDLVTYGNLIAQGGPFDRNLPNIATGFRQLHNRRNTIPESHPYDARGGAQNRWLERNEMNALTLVLQNCLDEMSRIVEQNRSVP
jgi:hypothetical protein